MSDKINHKIRQIKSKKRVADHNVQNLTLGLKVARVLWTKWRCQ